MTTLHHRREAERGQQWEPTTPVPVIQAQASPQAPPAHSNVRNLRPIPPTVQLMPGVVLYDHEADPDDVPVLPDLVALALSVLLRSVDVPGSVSRPHTCEASAIVRGHFRVGADDAPAHGYPRPVTA